MIILHIHKGYFHGHDRCPVVDVDIVFATVTLAISVTVAVSVTAAAVSSAATFS